MKTVSFVIPARNAEKTILRCLKSITSQQGQFNSEIIVVDNASLDHTSDTVMKNFPMVSLLFEPVVGRSNARNRGLETASGDFIAFVDADVSLDHQWTQYCLDALSEPSFSCVSTVVEPTAMNGSNREILLKIRKSLIEMNTNQSMNYLNASLNGIPQLNTAALFVRTNPLRKLDIKFDPSIQRCEDTDLALQFLAKGLHMKSESRAKAQVFFDGGVLRFILRFFEIGFSSRIVYLLWFDVPYSILKIYLKKLSKISGREHLLILYLLTFFQMLGEIYSHIMALRTKKKISKWNASRASNPRNILFFNTKFGSKKYYISSQVTVIDLEVLGVLYKKQRFSKRIIKEGDWAWFQSVFLSKSSCRLSGKGLDSSTGASLLAKLVEEKYIFEYQ